MESNELKYRNAFAENFGLETSEVDKLEYQSISDWDSVGHMGLIAQLEEAFSIQIEMDDVIALNSFEKGKEIMQKYGVNI